MKLSVGTKLHGFEVTRIREIQQLDGRLVEMHHEETGAELCWMDNGASNKLFSVAFKTLPFDDTGVFHILEHSVLCGSEKFPVKEPFVDLLKGSMQTFLNAMTYPDKTVYPISSRNKQDYLNLSEVYLDAVFAPKILTNKSIFMQEGWHMENDENGKPIFKGVVFNEMKGALADVSEKIDVSMNRLVFPDSIYRFVSGGEPCSIPELTYEKFRETWKNFYHPSNAKFYLDGDVPLDESLEMINSYISGKGRLDKLPELEMQKAVSGCAEIPYELGEDEDAENRTHFTMEKIIGTFADKTKIMAASVLSDYLAGSNESPVTKAVLDAELAQDVEIQAMDGIAQPLFCISAHNLNKEQIEPLKKLISDEIDKIIKNGIDKAELYACINQMEFNLRSMEEPQGLVRNINALDSWLYGGDPLLYLVHDDNFAELRDMVENGGFESLLAELFSAEGMCEVTAIPDKGLVKRMAEDENAELKRRCDLLSDSEKAELEKSVEELVKWQSAPDSPEAKAKLPMLALSEIAPEPEKINTKISSEDGVTVIRHNIASFGITHFTMYFAVPELSLEDISKVSLLKNIFGSLPTAKHSVLELQQLIRNYIGSVRLRLKFYADKGDRKRCKPYLAVMCSALDKNVGKAVELICEILTETDFSCKDMIKNIILQTEESNRRYLLSSGHALGISETRSAYSALCAAEEAAGGYSYVKCVSSLAENFDTESDKFAELLENTLKNAVCRKRLTLSITSNSAADVLSLISIPDGTAAEKYAEYTSTVPERLGVSVPSSVSYAVQGWHSQTRTGAMRTLSQIMSYDYLWSSVRVHGGAYGAGMKAFLNGDIICYSYRDPSPDKTLSVFSDTADALEKWCAGDERLENYIISSVAASEPLRSPQTEGMIQDEYVFSGVSFEDRTAERREMLDTTRDGLLGLCGLLREMGEKGSISVVANQQVLDTIQNIEVL